MAVIRQRGGSNRPGYTRRAFLLRTLNGKIIAQGWPRKRGKPKDEYLAALNQRLKDVVKHLRSLQAVETQPMTDAINEHNESVRGLKGAAALRVRDFFHQNAEGRAFAIQTTDSISSDMVEIPPGRLIYSASAARDISDALDWTQPQAGAILTRTSDAWLGTHACGAGAVFMLPTVDYQEGFCPEQSFWGDVKTEVNAMSREEADVQNSLDILTDVPGSILIRGDDAWQGLPPGAPGQVLAIGTDGLPGWYDPDALPS